jgi:hypothetical protein
MNRLVYMYSVNWWGYGLHGGVWVASMDDMNDYETGHS